MIDCSCIARQLDHWIRLNRAFRADLEWWRTFLTTWNCHSMMHVHAYRAPPDLTLESDASGSWGCGAIWENSWIQCTWENTWQGESITVKELLPIVLACGVWGPDWSHKRVEVHCNNMAVVLIIKAQTSCDKSIMHLLSCLHFICAIYDISLKATHLPGKENICADAISRNYLQVLAQHRPLINPRPSTFPPVSGA